MLQIISDKCAWDRVWGAVESPSVMGSFDYVTAGATLESRMGEALLCVWEDAGGIVAHPTVRRRIPGGDGLTDLISAFDFGGLWFSPGPAAERARRLAAFEEAYFRWAAGSGAVSEFIRFHPFHAPADLAFSRFRNFLYCDNVFVDLTRPMAEIRAGYRPPRRRQVAQGRRAGLNLVAAEDFGIFYDIYFAGLDRLGAPRRYYFPRGFLESIRFCLDLRYIVAKDGEIVGAHAYIIDGDTALAFLCHSRPEASALRPNDFAYDAMIEEYAGRGLRRLHLGSGAPSLHHYKASYSPDRVPYHLAHRSSTASATRRCPGSSPRVPRPGFFRCTGAMSAEWPVRRRISIRLSRAPTASRSGLARRSNFVLVDTPIDDLASDKPESAEELRQCGRRGRSSRSSRQAAVPQPESSFVNSRQDVGTLPVTCRALLGEIGKSRLRDPYSAVIDVGTGLVASCQQGIYGLWHGCALPVAP